MSARSGAEADKTFSLVRKKKRENRNNHQIERKQIELVKWHNVLVSCVIARVLSCWSVRVVMCGFK